MRALALTVVITEQDTSIDLLVWQLNSVRVKLTFNHKKFYSMLHYHLKSHNGLIDANSVKT